MVKQSRHMNRGIPKGVQKHRIQRRVPETVATLIESKNTTGTVGKIHDFGEICWVYLVTACSKLCLIPLKPSKDRQGHFEPCPFWGRLLHYFVVTAGLILLGHKTIVTVDLMINEHISVRTYMCLLHMSILFATAMSCTGSTIKSREIQGVLNSWDSILHQLEEMNGNRPKLFSITSLCMKVIAITCNLQLAAVLASLFTVVSDSLPVCLYPTFKRYGILPENSLPEVLWRIGFYPLELTTLLLPMIGTAFNACAVAIGIEVLRVYNTEMR